MSTIIVYVGLDVHQDSMMIAKARGNDGAELVGEMLHNIPQLLRQLQRLGPRENLRVCYEAGPTGFDL